MLKFSLAGIRKSIIQVSVKAEYDLWFRYWNILNDPIRLIWKSWSIDTFVLTRVINSLSNERVRTAVTSKWLLLPPQITHKPLQQFSYCSCPAKTMELSRIRIKSPRGKPLLNVYSQYSRSSYWSSKKRKKKTMKACSLMYYFFIQASVNEFGDSTISFCLSHCELGWTEYQTWWATYHVSSMY